MNERERRIVEDVLLAFFIEHAESDEVRAGWERARREHHRGENCHPAPARMRIPGTDDARAAAALKAREALLADRSDDALTEPT